MDMPIPFPRYRQRIVARRGGEFVAIPAVEAAYFHSDDKLTFLVARDGQRYLVDVTLAELETSLDPRDFFRVNRQILASAAAIASFRPMGKGKLLIDLAPRPRAEVIVSQERAGPFRAWLSQ
jgi:two-component system LytT family response regulator